MLPKRLPGGHLSPDLCSRRAGDMAAVVDEVSTLLREEHKSPLKTIVAALQTALELRPGLAGTRLKTLGCCICAASYDEEGAG